MTDFLSLCLAITGLLVLATLALIVLPISPGELQLWHFIRIQRVRQWITRTRRVAQPLHPVQTPDMARTNLRWHLFLTFLFFVLIARALTLESWWLRTAASLLVVPSLAYALGSLVQRQKIAIMSMRSRNLRKDRTVTPKE